MEAGVESQLKRRRSRMVPITSATLHRARVEGSGTAGVAVASMVASMEKATWAAARCLQVAPESSDHRSLTKVTGGVATGS